jgi:hypothetical protein
MGMERAMGIEPTLSAWKAEVLPLNYARSQTRYPLFQKNLLTEERKSSAPIWKNFPFSLEGAGFEPAKAEPSDLQSDPFDRSGTPPPKNRP